MIPTLDLSSPGLAVASAAVLGFAVGLVPIGLAEVLALTIGAVVPPSLALTMLAAFTLAHVLGKVAWYWLGTLAERVTHARTRELVVRARALIGAHRASGAGVLGAAALFSVPPFHLAAIAAGIARIPFVQFVAICLAGRAVRFGMLASVPTLVRALLG